MKRAWLCIAAGVALGEVLAYACGADRFLTAAAVPAAVFVLLFLLRSLCRSGRGKTVLIVLLISLSVGWARMGLCSMRLQKPVSAADLLIRNIEFKNERYVITCPGLIIYADPDCPVSFTQGRKGSGETDSLSPPGPESPLSRVAASGLPETLPPGIESLTIGSRISVSGDITPIDPARNPGEFDNCLYQKANGITCRSFADEITVIKEASFSLLEMLRKLQQNFLSHLDLVFDPDDAGFLRAALLGDKSLLSGELYDLYRSNGIAHLLAISGLHVSILGMSFYRLLRRFKVGYTQSGLAAGSFLVLYCLITGSGTSTVRAVIMLLLHFLANMEGRRYDLLSSAGFAASLMLLISPYDVFSCGFLLSFGAVLAIGGPASAVLSMQKKEETPPEEADDDVDIIYLDIPAASPKAFDSGENGQKKVTAAETAQSQATFLRSRNKQKETPVAEATQSQAAFLRFRNKQKETKTPESAQSQTTFLRSGAGPGGRIDRPDNKAARELNKLAASLLSSLTISVTVQMITLPVLAWFFFEVSVYGVLLNLIVIPLMNYVLLSGIAALTFSFFSVTAGIFAGGACHYILLLYRILCSFAGKLPCATILIGRPSLWQIGIYYFALFFFLYCFPGPLRKHS